ncbi:hypothetical protein PHMEG_00012739 [Phytophthora megakarya]|uniref:Uncharacterized protein n=1 Tax=Phytophthora megakarya TaxID=4795 RepID=A0A225W810_9STRA|nr:hypothetical protein PHMEG_00012739 [Phytophthora megakarya]
MINSTLTKRLLIPPGSLFPARTSFDRLPFQADHRCQRVDSDGHGAMARTSAESPPPLTFDHNLHRRANTPLWRITPLYATLEEDQLIAYWESTHYLKITKAMLASDPVLFIYHQDRRQRRIRVGDRCRKLLGACLQMMRSQWADIDLLLDPYFLHLPTPQDRVR